MGVRKSSDKYDVVNTWDKVAQSYDEQAYWDKPENHANLRALLSHIGDASGKHIIEVGCGSGFTSLALARMGASCALLDVSPASMEVARSAFISAGLPEPECYLENALESSVPSGAFDVVWNSGVLEHFLDPDKERMILEMLRMVKPDGVVIILVPNSWCWEFQIKQALLKIARKWIFGFEDDMSPRRLSMMCRRLGLTPDTVYAYNPVLGWCWYKNLRRIIDRLGWNTAENQSRRSWMGMMSVLVIRKDKANSGQLRDGGLVSAGAPHS